jgi:hypothetical protein
MRHERKDECIKHERILHERRITCFGFSASVELVWLLGLRTVWRKWVTMCRSSSSNSTLSSTPTFISQVLCVLVRACLRACVRAVVHACVHACGRACVCVCAREQESNSKREERERERVCACSNVGTEV